MKKAMKKKVNQTNGIDLQPMKKAAVLLLKITN
jgi:hypothetical protein